MDELAELQAAFEAVQLTTVRNLAERSCVEILMKLIEQKKVDLIYTIDGKEYVTHKQLRNEILDEVLVHGGRINVVDLQTILNMDLTHIETKLNDIIAKDKSYYLVNGDLIASYYFDGIARELNESLQATAQVQVEELAIRFSLPSAFIRREVIEKRLGSIIKGHLEGDVLYVQAYVDRTRSRIKALFAAITRPTPISGLIRQYNFSPTLFDSVLQELISEGLINGTVSGRRDKAQFIPTIFTTSRHRIINSYYIQNGTIEYKVLHEMEVEKPEQYMKKHYPKGSEIGGVALESCFVSNSVVTRVEAEICECVISQSILNIAPILQASLSPNDIAGLVNSCPSFNKAANKVYEEACRDGEIGSKENSKEEGKEKKPGGRSCSLLADTFVVSGSLVTQLVDKFTASYMDQIVKSKTQSISAQSELKEAREGKEKNVDGKEKKGDKSEGQPGHLLPSKDKKTKGKGKGKGKGKKRGKGGEEDDEDDEEEVPKTKVKEKKKQPSGPGSTSEKGFRISLLETRKRLQEWLPDYNDEIIGPLAQFLQPELVRQFLRISESLSATPKSVSGKKHLQLQKDFEAAHFNLQLFAKHLEKFGDDKGLMQKHLIKTIGNDITNLLVSSQTDIPEVTSKNRLEVLKNVPVPAQTKLYELVDRATSSNSSVDDFISALTDAASVCEFHLKKLDKKIEKALTFHHRKAMESELEEEGSEGNERHGESPLVRKFHTAVVLLCLKFHKVLLHAPAKALPFLLENLKSDVSEDDFEVFTKYNSMLIQLHLEKDNEKIDLTKEELEALWGSVLESYKSLVAK